MSTLAAREWRQLVQSHARRADTLTSGYRARRARAERHAVEDFLFEYYGTRPSLLRRWHPGAGVRLEAGVQGPAPHGRWRWYATDETGAVVLDAALFVKERADTVLFIHRLLTAISSRPAFTGCFGLHEWAMVYRQEHRRHTLPLRLGDAATNQVVEDHSIRCTHFDAYRFFSPEAEPLNRVRPTRDAQVELEQPGCLHAAMDCHKWASKLGPAVPGHLALDCFELARDVRWLDMRASPYDLSSYGAPPVPIETPEGKATYVRHQREFARRADLLRGRLVNVCEGLLGG